MIETARDLSSCVAPRIESPRSARSPCPSGVFPNRHSPPKPFPPSRETPSPFSPSALASLRLWTAGRITALSRARSAPASPLRTSPGTRGSELAPLPTSPSLPCETHPRHPRPSNHTHLKSQISNPQPLPPLQPSVPIRTIRGPPRPSPHQSFAPARLCVSPITASVAHRQIPEDTPKR
jgi:hypothetical protein